MEKMNEDLVMAVRCARDQVSDRRYTEAVATLKAAGGQIAAFAALYAALVAAGLGAGMGTGLLMATMSNPIGIGVTFVVGVGGSTVGVLLGAERINALYDEMNRIERQALTDMIVWGVQKVWIIRKAWRFLAR